MIGPPHFRGGTWELSGNGRDTGVTGGRCGGSGSARCEWASHVEPPARYRSRFAQLPDYTHYAYRVLWSPEDDEFVGLCAEFPARSYPERAVDVGEPRAYPPSRSSDRRARRSGALGRIHGPQQMQLKISRSQITCRHRIRLSQYFFRHIRGGVVDHDPLTVLDGRNTEPIVDQARRTLSQAARSASVMFRNPRPDTCTSAITPPVTSRCCARTHCRAARAGHRPSSPMAAQHWIGSRRDRIVALPGPHLPFSDGLARSPTTRR